jgi:TRAP-type C4-dicarboxylate transport system permease small subunit
VLAYFGTIVAVKVSDWIMPATEISRALVYGACPVGSLFMLYYALGHVAETFSADFRSDHADVTMQNESAKP